jgi:hypothetical protein
LTHVIWKHPLQRDALTTLDLAVGAVVLHVDTQDEWLRLWEAHDPDQQQTEKRTFRIVGTGHVEDFDPAQHVGTILVDDGTWVLHVFEESH